MNARSQSSPAPTPVDRVREGVQIFEETMVQNEGLRDRVRQLEAINSVDKMTIEQQNKRVADLEARLRYYMQFSTELCTHVSDMVDIANKAIQKAREGAFRPEAVKAIGLAAGEEVETGKLAPSFLTEKPKEETFDNMLRKGREQ